MEQWLEQQSHQKKKKKDTCENKQTNKIQIRTSTNSKNLKLTEQCEANQVGTEMVMKEKGVAFCSSLFANGQLASLLC